MIFVSFIENKYSRAPLISSFFPLFYSFES